jgi:hypothetical protein
VYAAPLVVWLAAAGDASRRLLVDVPPAHPGWFLGVVYINDCAEGRARALLLKRFLADPIRLKSMRDLGFYCLFRGERSSAAQCAGRCGRPSWSRSFLLVRR